MLQVVAYLTKVDCLIRHVRPGGVPEPVRRRLGDLGRSVRVFWLLGLDPLGRHR